MKPIINIVRLIAGVPFLFCGMLGLRIIGKTNRQYAFEYIIESTLTPHSQEQA